MGRTDNGVHMINSNTPKVALSVKECGEVGPVGHQGIYNAINSGKLRAKKYGKRTIILVDDYRDFLSSLPDYEPAA